MKSILNMQNFWEDLLPPIISRLPDNVISSTITDNHNHKFYIIGIEKSIYYSISLKNDEFFIGFYCHNKFLQPLLIPIFKKIAINVCSSLIRYDCVLKVEKTTSLDNIEFDFLNFIYMSIYLFDDNLIMNTANYLLLNHINDRINYIFDIINTDKLDNPNFLFQHFYDYHKWKTWTGSDPKIISGYISFLNNFIKSNNIKTICDIGCGDWRYMKYVNLDNINYIGYDVAKSIIENNINLFSSSNISFKYYDGDFNKISNADLAICKEVIQHLPNKYIFDFINIIPKFKYVLCANVYNENLKVNRDIKLGECRWIDLRLPPFNIKAELVYKIDRSSIGLSDIAVFSILI